MDFDSSKENIQPLRGGRNVSQLGAALQAQNNQEIQREVLLQKEAFEHAIRTYEGDDPLDNWYQYISWVEQTYPKHGHEGNLMSLLQHCLGKFENDERYANDRRFCKLCIKYNDLDQNPLQLYHAMYSRNVCRGCADFYKAWAYYHEAAGDYQNANKVFEYGKQALAQPYEELENAHKNLIMAAGQHMLYGPDEVRLVEKRQALTSLLTYKPGQVGSIRHRASGTAVLPNSVGGSSGSRPNMVVPVYDDHGENHFGGAIAAPVSIVNIAKKEAHKENTLKPGPWTTVPVKKGSRVTPKGPGFTVHEDGSEPNISVYEGIRLPANYPQETFENYSDWTPTLTIPEAQDNRMIPMYPKAKVYSQPNTEFSIEELRSIRYRIHKHDSSHMGVVESNQSINPAALDVNQLKEVHSMSHHSNYEQSHIHSMNNNEQYLHHQQVIGNPHEHFSQIHSQTSQQISTHSPFPVFEDQLPKHISQTNSSFSMYQDQPQVSKQLHLIQAATHCSQVSPFRDQISAPETITDIFNSPNNAVSNNQYPIVILDDDNDDAAGQPLTTKENVFNNSPNLVKLNDIDIPIVIPDEVEEMPGLPKPQMHGIPVNQPYLIGQTSDFSQPFISPVRPPQQNDTISNFDVWNIPQCSNEVQVKRTPREVSKFTIYEQSNLGMQPKGSAMKTPFKILTADELAETGSRGGMDVAAAAQPHDGAKRLNSPYNEDSSGSSFDDIHTNNQPLGDLNYSCSNTEMFTFNLNAMKVSTPQNKQAAAPVLQTNTVVDNNARKQLFSFDKPEKGLSVIMEETKSSLTSSSSGTTKSSLYSKHTTNMGMISEEHNSNLLQNSMANDALRRSLLGHFMDFDTPTPEVAPPVQAMQASPIQTPPTSPVRSIPPSTPVEPVDQVPADPFNPFFIKSLLKRVNFPGVHIDGYIQSAVPTLQVRKTEIKIANDKYLVEKQLGKGTYGTVFKAINGHNGQKVALKYQKPPNFWEYYICREIRSRLIDNPMRDRFMDVTVGYFSEQASILVSEYMPCGSLLDVRNVVRTKSGKTLKESLCIYFTLEMLRIVEVMHQVKIIHADIKPDNFLACLTNDGTIQLQLIDFGCSIDMSFFPPGAAFMKKVVTANFICCEMLDDRPWNYHTDLFCIAATIHVLLFDKYMELEKKDNIWSIEQKCARYMKKELWGTFFSSLLNQQTGLADTKTLQLLLEENLYKFDDFNNDMRYVVNILMNR